MAPTLSTRLKGLVFLASGIVTAAIIVYLALNPESLVDAHPVPLLVLLVLTMVISFWQASALLQ